VDRRLVVVMADVEKSHLVELDSMALMMLKQLRQHELDEPVVPEDGRYQHEEMSALHYEWSRAHQAIRLLLGIQLVNLAEEQLKETT
jgi:hypothetical protein